MNTKQKSPKQAIIMTAGAVVLAAAAGIIAMTCSASAKEKQNAELERLSALTDAQTQILEDYVLDAEQVLMPYSEAEPVKALLRDPDNTALAEQAQAYTAQYSQNLGETDSLYISRYDTCVLAHSDSKYVGMVTRPDEETRRTLFETMASADDGVYNAGILLSPSDSIQYLCMYRLAGSKDDPAGYTGISMSTAELENRLKAGAGNASFTMLGAADATNIFGSGAVRKETENARFKKLCSEVREDSVPASGTLTYKDDSGKHLAAYSYMPEYDWLLIADAKA